MKSRYTGVYYIGLTKDQRNKQRAEQTPWRSTIKIGIRGCSPKSMYFATEREAAIQYDKWVIEYRLNRKLNILKPKP